MCEAIDRACEGEEGKGVEMPMTTILQNLLTGQQETWKRLADLEHNIMEATTKALDGARADRHELRDQMQKHVDGSRRPCEYMSTMMPRVDRLEIRSADGDMRTSRWLAPIVTSVIAAVVVSIIMSAVVMYANNERSQNEKGGNQPPTKHSNP